MTMNEAGSLCALALAMALLGVGCGAFDQPVADDDTGGTDGGDTGQVDPNGGPGVWLDCGYHLSDTNFPASSGVGYPHPRTMCVDPASPQFDANGDGSLNLQEMIGACELKCPNHPDDYPFFGPGLSGNWDAAAPADVHPPFNGCFAVEARVDPDAGACDPSHSSHSEPWPATLTPPTHQGTFTSGQQQSPAVAKIKVNGATRSPKFSGGVAFSITDCDERGRNHACLLDLQRLSLALDSGVTFGEYEVGTAELSLNRSVLIPISLACSATRCSGSVDLVRSGATVAADLNFEQKHLPTSNLGGGYLRLGPDGVGRFTHLVGELELDRKKSAGSLRLRGAAKDAAGGEFASVNFDLTSAVSRPSL